MTIESYTIPIYEVDSKEIPFQRVSTAKEFTYNVPISIEMGHHSTFDSLGVPIRDFLYFTRG
ncbi:MAG: hypothetical protein WA958_11680 [Tunicatimonas sp.]